MLAYSERKALLDIQRNDPDGFPWEPTPQRKAEHRRWAIESYGVALWKRYVRPGGWDDNFTY